MYVCFSEGIIKTNYLNNRDILKEIHLSKNSYCSFRNFDKDNQYDIILFDVNEIKSNLEIAKANRAARILRETGQKIDLSSINNTDLVFRVMTWEHIPMLPPKELKSDKLFDPLPGQSLSKFFDSVVEEDLDEDDEIDLCIKYDPINNVKADHIRINFPPFFHYRMDNNNTLYIVGKSHWQGSLELGHFCKTHGDLTETLARMIMKLTEKYASKGNWRNYSYREEMEGQAIMQLIQVILQFDESKSNNPFAFATQIAHNSFLRILNLEKKNQEIRDDLLVKAGMNPSYSRSTQNANALYDGGFNE
jgi:hypothetical protein